MAIPKLQDIVNAATKGTTSTFWDVITGETAMRDLRKQYSKSLSFVDHDAELGIPKKLEESYNRAVKDTAKKLWQGVMKVAASGFGKGLLLTAAVVFGGAAVIFGGAALMGLPSILGVSLLTQAPLTGALAAATVPEAVGMGLATAGNFLFGSLTGVMTLITGGTLTVVNDVHKHYGKVTAEMARVEADNLARQRQQNMEREIQVLKESLPSRQDAKDAKAAEGVASFAAREAMRKQEQTNNIYKSL